MPGVAKRRGAESKQSESTGTNKRSFIRRLLRPLEVIVELLTVLVTQPRSFPHAFALVFRHAFRAVWDARGGGLYAVGFFVTFVWLEVMMFVEDVAEASGVGDFVTSQLFEVFIRYTVESVGNTVRAFLWPVYALQYQPPIGLILLAAAFILFPRYLKPSFERWLFDRDTATEDEHENDDTARRD